MGHCPCLNVDQKYQIVNIIGKNLTGLWLDRICTIPYVSKHFLLTLDPNQFKGWTTILLRVNNPAHVIGILDPNSFSFSNKIKSRIRSISAILVSSLLTSWVRIPTIDSLKSLKNQLKIKIWFRIQIYLFQINNPTWIKSKSLFVHLSSFLFNILKFSRQIQGLDPKNPFQC